MARSEASSLFGGRTEASNSNGSSGHGLPDAESMRHLPVRSGGGRSQRSDNVSFLTSTPIEEFVAKYQVIKVSWRGKYERIFALAPTRFCTIDPRDFEVTNTWSLTALISINLDPSDPQGFVLTLKGAKKDEQLKLRCRFRSRLLSDLYRLKDQYQQRNVRPETGYQCTKWSRKNTTLECVLEVGMDGITCTQPGVVRSKYLYTEMEHLTLLADSQDAFAIGYIGRSRLFFSQQRGQIFHRIQAAAEAIGCAIKAQSDATVEKIQEERMWYGLNQGDPFVQFHVRKLTPKYNDPRERVISLHDKVLVELDQEDKVVSCYNYTDIYVLVRDPTNAEQFEIQFRNDQVRKYLSKDRDGVLSAIYDICVTCEENDEVFISSVMNQRGLRLLPFCAAEDTSETQSFFNDSSIGSWYLQRMSVVGKFGNSLKVGDRGFVEIVAEFNANVPASGIPYKTKHSIIGEALRPMCAQLYYVAKTKPVPERAAVTLIQALFRIASSYYGFREIGQAGQISETLTNLLINGEEFVVFWTALLLRKLTTHTPPNSAGLDNSSMKYCEEVETHNKKIFFANSYLTESLITHLQGIDIELASKKHTGTRPRAGPLVMMGLLQTLEGCLCSHAATTGPVEFMALIEGVAKFYSTLLKVLFQSRCATTVEACTLLLKTTLEECDPVVASNIRDKALTEGIVLRHFYQSLFDDSFDQRCVSRYLVSLWMSHHDGSKQLLSRIIPMGFFHLLKEPPGTSAQIDDYDRLEREAMEMERFERLQEFNDGDDRMSSTSESTLRGASMDWLSGGETGSLEGSDMSQNKFVRKRVSMDEISGDNGHVGGMHSESRRASISNLPIPENRSSFSGERASLTWSSVDERKYAEAPIENEHSKARMLRKLKSSVDGTNMQTPSNSSRGSHSRKSDSNGLPPRVRKRDVAMSFLTGTLPGGRKPTSQHKRKASKGNSVTTTRSTRAQENFRLLFHMLSLDHEAIEMIWNRSTREELRQALFAEIKRFTQFQTHSGAMQARWNYEDFAISFSSLANEVVVGGCYIRILAHLRSKMSFFGSVSEEDEFIVLTPEQVRVRDPAAVLSALYVRMLRENIRAEYRDELETSILCIKSMGVVAAAHAGYVNAVNFEEIGHLWTLMGETVHASMLENLLHTVRALCLHPGNARRVLRNGHNIEIAIHLLQLAHSTNRDIGDITEPKKLWILETEQGDELGPFSVNELKQKRDEERTDMSAFTVRRQDDPACEPLTTKAKVMEVAQLRWEVGILGGVHSRQMAHDAASILLSVARSNSLLGDNSAQSGELIFPPPQGKMTLWKYGRRILPVLARSDSPKLWEKVATLLEFLYTANHPIGGSRHEDTNRSSLYVWGLFYLAFIEEKAEFKAMAGLLKATHLLQDGFNGASALFNILPKAMINLLGTSSPAAFTKVFCDGKRSPQVIWSAAMRNHLQTQCATHMEDYVEALEEDGSRMWRFTPMAPVSFKELAEEVWCSGVYLGQFCEHQDFVISDPLDFMKKLTTIWRAETSREDSPVDITRARHILGLAQESVTITETALRASFKKKARALVQPDLAVVNYNDRLEELQEAYRVLTCPRATLLSAGHDPVNLLLILHSLIVMCNRYPEELSSYEFDSYDLLLPLLASHCSAEGVYPEGTTKAQALEISVCAAELVYNTCAVSVINGNVLMDQPDLNVLEKVVNFCVDSMVGGEAADHPELQETCFFVLQTITGLLASSRGRVWIASSSTLVVDLVRVLWLWNQADEKSFFLSKIAQQALEGISRMAQVEKNQERLVQAGILYQLFALLSTYEVELDDITVHNRLQNNISSMDENFADVAVEVQNLLAIMAVRALCRLGGLFPEGSELQSPHNALVKRVADALMTPNLSGLLLLGSHHEFLKIFHGECESYTLFWNAEMRQEQATFVSSRSSVEPTMSTVERYVEAVEFRYMYLADLFAIGGLYIEILMGSLLVIEKNLIPAHVSELGLTEAFFHELFSFIDSGELICPEYVDESGNLQKLPPYAGWNIDKEQLATMDRVTALNCLSITASVAPTLVEENLVANDSAMKMVLRLLFPPDNEVHQSEDAEKSLVLTPQLYVPCRLHCLATLRVLSTLDSFGKASLEFGICDILIELVHICQDVGPQVLEIIRNLCAYGAAADCVAEILQSGCYLEFIGWVLLVEETIVDDEFDAAESLRIPSAMILSEMVKNGAPLNIESRRALCRFFPPAIVRSIASTPETIVEYIMADHMTPELVWNVEFRNHQRNSVVNFLNIYFSASSTTETEDGKFTSVVDSFEIDYTGLYPAPMTGNVYLTLFMEDPTFNLHDSLYFLTCLWSEFEVLFRQLAHMTSALRATMARADDELIQRDIDLIDLVGSSLVCLLQVDTKLLDNVAEMQIPSKCCDFLNETVRSQACEPCVVNVARVLRVCSISRACIESLQPMCSTALSCLMALTNPIRGGPLHFESAYVMEIMRRIVLQYPEHGDRDASVGIVYLASRLDLFGFLLNILDNPDGIGKVKEPHILRAEAIEILNMLEKDRIQGNTAHQLLKKHKKWQKIYRHEATDVVMSMSTEDPFLQRLYPEADRVMREYVRMNPRNSTIV